MTWRYTDARGHEHHLSLDGFPTLRWIVDEVRFDEDTATDASPGHWECPLCGEHITPQMSVDMLGELHRG